MARWCLTVRRVRFLATSYIWTNVFMSVYCLQRSNIESGGWVRKFGNCGIVHVGN